VATGAIAVKGLKELTRDFKRMSKDLDKGLTKELQRAAEPAAQKAEELALGKIRNMPRSPHWAGMRIGVARARGVVYMVPAARRSSRRARPNLSPLLLERAMQPAVEDTAPEIIDRMGDFIDRIADGNGFV
jgi:hypothetical protein